MWAIHEPSLQRVYRVVLHTKLYWGCWKIYWSRYFVAATMMMLKCNLISTQLLVCYPLHYCFNRWIFLRWLCGVAGAEKSALWWSLWKYGRLIHEDEIQDCQFEVGKLHVMPAECNSKYNVMCWCCWPHKSDEAHKALYVVVAACALTIHELYPKTLNP